MKPYRVIRRRFWDDKYGRNEKRRFPDKKRISGYNVKQEQQIKMNPVEAGNQHRVSELSDQELKEPPLFNVLLLNDNYTTMEFVVHVLIEIFHKTFSEATKIMLEVHHNGSGICGTFTREIAETKIRAVHGAARQAGFPLKASMEKA